MSVSESAADVTPCTCPIDISALSAAVLEAGETPSSVVLDGGTGLSVGDDFGDETGFGADGFEGTGALAVDPFSDDVVLSSRLGFAVTEGEAEVEKVPVTLTVVVSSKAPAVLTAKAPKAEDSDPHRWWGQCCLKLAIVAGARKEETF